MQQQPAQAGLEVAAAAGEQFPALRARGPTMEDEQTEFTRALAFAANGQVGQVADKEQAARRMRRGLGWTRVRARWFMAVNHEQIEALARDLRQRQVAGPQRRRSPRGRIGGCSS
jgi:hypothetical protein